MVEPVPAVRFPSGLESALVRVNVYPSRERWSEVARTIHAPYETFVMKQSRSAHRAQRTFVSAEPVFPFELSPLFLSRPLVLPGFPVLSSLLPKYL